MFVEARLPFEGCLRAHSALVHRSWSSRSIWTGIALVLKNNKKSNKEKIINGKKILTVTLLSDIFCKLKASAKSSNWWQNWFSPSWFLKWWTLWANSNSSFLGITWANRSFRIGWLSPFVHKGQLYSSRLASPASPWSWPLIRPPLRNWNDGQKLNNQDCQLILCRIWKVPFIHILHEIKWEWKVSFWQNQLEQKMDKVGDTANNICVHRRTATCLKSFRSGTRVSNHSFLFDFIWNWGNVIFKTKTNHSYLKILYEINALSFSQNFPTHQSQSLQHCQA